MGAKTNICKVTSLFKSNLNGYNTICEFNTKKKLTGNFTFFSIFNVFNGARGLRGSGMRILDSLTD